MFDVVKQSANCGNNDFATGAQVGSLFVHIDTAEEDGVAQRKIFNVCLHVLIDLIGQFAGWGQYQHADRMHGRGGAGCGVAFQTFEAGQHKGGGFTCAGLCCGQKVVSRQGFRNRCSLDRRRVFITLIGQGRD